MGGHALVGPYTGDLAGQGGMKLEAPGAGFDAVTEASSKNAEGVKSMRIAGSYQLATMESVIYGKLAGEALREDAERLGAKCVYLIASRTLNTTTDEIAKIRKILGDRQLADGGAAGGRFQLIGKNAMLSIFTRANPQPIREPGDVVEILKMAA
jgi:hypothetical protein